LAVAAAVLFGASTPAVHWLLADCPPLLLSALLYLGSGSGLGLWYLASGGGITGRRSDSQGLRDLHTDEWLPLAGAILLGGVLAPVCLLAGMQSISAASTSLLLNLEGVFTALLAWWLFREAADRWLIIGMACVVVAGLMLGLPQAGEILPRVASGSGLPGAALITLACLCWGLDNNLTRSVAHLDARGVAMWKGLIAGSVNLLMALLYGSVWPTPRGVLLALLVGFLGYGLSLVAYVRAQGLLGAARTGAWFGLAPFVGVFAALIILRERPPELLWPASALMAIGLALHLREQHSHPHRHLAQTHSHLHRHDQHHQHAHEQGWQGSEPHQHLHTHEAQEHAHVHYPDLHHRHDHLDPASALDAKLVAAYRATRYRVDADPPFHLRIGTASPELAALLLQGARASAAFLTPANPLGSILPEAENILRLSDLVAELEARGYSVVAGVGESTDGVWSAEPSVLVPGLSRAETLELAARWRQNAVVWCGDDCVPQLLLLY
jgi:drug/metabolite transporter (DMT)-like permease